jgi:hypothetical protein
MVCWLCLFPSSPLALLGQPILGELSNSSILVIIAVTVLQLPKLLELIGLVYSSWFIYRYLLFKDSREELIADVDELKSKIVGK